MQHFAVASFPVTGGPRELLAHFPLDGDLTANRGALTANSDATLVYDSAVSNSGIDTDRNSIASDLGRDGFEDLRILAVEIPEGVPGQSAADSMTVSFWSDLVYLLAELHAGTEVSNNSSIIVDLSIKRTRTALVTEISMNVLGMQGHVFAKNLQLEIGTFHHFAFILDELSSIWVYLDGEPAAAHSAGTHGDCGVRSLVLGLGEERSGDLSSIAGTRLLIDELSIIRGALSADEIKALYEGTITYDDFPVGS